MLGRANRHGVYLTDDEVLWVWLALELKDSNVTFSPGGSVNDKPAQAEFNALKDLFFDILESIKG